MASGPRNVEEPSGDVGDVKVEIYSSPNQPNVVYPRDERNEKFHYEWFQRWPWLDWNDGIQRVLCHPCSMTNALHIRLLSKAVQPVFTTTGFSNWHDATQRFNKHEESDSHAESLNQFVSGHHICLTLTFIFS